MYKAVFMEGKSCLFKNKRHINEITIMAAQAIGLARSLAVMNEIEGRSHSATQSQLAGAVRMKVQWL